MPRLPQRVVPKTCATSPARRLKATVAESEPLVENLREIGPRCCLSCSPCGAKPRASRSPSGSHASTATLDLEQARRPDRSRRRPTLCLGLGALLVHRPRKRQGGRGRLGQADSQSANVGQADRRIQLRQQPILSHHAVCQQERIQGIARSVHPALEVGAARAQGDHRLWRRSHTRAHRDRQQRHYVLASDGAPLDVLPGLYAPRQFMGWLADMKRLHGQVAGLEPAERLSQLRQYHARALAAKSRGDWPATCGSLRPRRSTWGNHRKVPTPTRPIRSPGWRCRKHMSNCRSFASLPAIRQH